MYNFCVVLARCIFGKNDKCLVWNSLIDRILILRRSRSFAAPSLLSPRLGMSTVFTAYASKNADWNQQQLTDGGIWANRNSANPPYCFLSNQKKVQILAFFTCDPTKKCIMPSSRERHKRDNRERAWSLSRSRLRDSGEKSFSKRKEKNARELGRDRAAALSHFSRRHRPVSQVARVLFSLCSFNTSPLYYLRAWHRLMISGYLGWDIC